MGAENQAKTTTNNGQKRKRRYLPHNKGVKYPLKPGVKGFFITCDGGRESQASHEAINVIDSFFEELIHGEGSRGNRAATPQKPLNKKIKFTYSDSSDNEEDDGNDDESEEENQSERPAENGADNGNIVEENPNSAKKDDQLHEVGSRKVADGNEEASKQAAEEASKQAADGDQEASKQAADGDQEASKQANGHEEASKQADVGTEEASKQVNGKSNENEEPPAKKPCCDSKELSRNHQNTEKSVDQLIEAELKELGDKSKRRFCKIDTGCNGVVFIQMRRRDGDPSPKDIVQHMMESASATKKHLSRFLLRVLPVEVSCYASEEEISRAIKPLIEQHFPADVEAPVKFAVQYDARANTGIERMKIIDAVAKSVPGPHKVDLKTPEKTIIVQVVKTVCLIGVVEKYKELLKYNLRQLTSPKP